MISQWPGFGGWPNRTDWEPLQHFRILSAAAVFLHSSVGRCVSVLFSRLAERLRMHFLVSNLGRIGRRSETCCCCSTAYVEQYGSVRWIAQGYRWNGFRFLLPACGMPPAGCNVNRLPETNQRAAIRKVAIFLRCVSTWHPFREWLRTLSDWMGIQSRWSEFIYYAMDE